MARDESERENLLAEATALVERIEIIPRRTLTNELGSRTEAESIVAGFRANGAFSLFFGEDPVYQFNAVRELRRSYAAGRVYKSVGGRLVELNRVRQSHQVELRRHDLTPEEASDFLSRMIHQLRDLRALLDTGDFRIVGQIPPDTNVIDRMQNWLAENNAPIIAKRPNA